MASVTAVGADVKSAAPDPTVTLIVTVALSESRTVMVALPPVKPLTVSVEPTKLADATAKHVHGAATKEAARDAWHREKATGHAA